MIQTYQPGFSDLHQLLHMLVDGSPAKHWMKLAQWKHQERDLDQQIPYFWQNARKLTENLQLTITVAFLESIDWNNNQAHKQSLTNLFITLTVDFRLFSNTIVVFL